jgi:YYY domain-containing protein
MQTTDPLSTATPTAETPRPRAQASPLRLTRTDTLAALLFVGIMLLGGCFRFVGLNWDDFTHLHPDERFLTDVAMGLGRGLNPSGSESERAEQIGECLARYPDSAGVGGYFDARCSPWNPHNANPNHGMYVYGTLPLFMARGMGELMVVGSEWLARDVLSRFNNDPSLLTYSGVEWRGYNGVHLAWRFLSAMAEMGVIVIAFLIGRKLHDRWVGLLAAALYMGAVFSIQIGHFGTTDAIANFFAALTILFAVSIQQHGRLADYALFGLAFGAAIASRINLVFLLALLGLAVLLQIAPVFDRALARGQRERLIGRAALGCVLAGIGAFLAFRLGNPYAFMGPGFFGLSLNPRWLQDLATAQTLVRGDVDSPPNFQWLGRAPYFFPWWNMVMWGMGLAFGLTAWASVIWAGWRIVRGRPGALANLIPLAWVLIYFGYMGRQWVMTMRYFLPIYLTLAVLAAWGLMLAYRIARERMRAGRRFGRVRFSLAGGWIAAVILLTTLWALMFTNIYRNMLTRVQASHYVFENIPGDFAMRIEGGPDDAPLIQIGVPNSFGGSDRDLLSRLTRWDEATGRISSVEYFTPLASGTVSVLHAPHLGDPNDDDGAEVMEFRVYHDPSGTLLATARLDENLTRTTSIAGDPVDLPFDQPFAVTAGDRYRFEITLIAGGPVVSGGTIFTWEGAWDDPVPTKVCTLPIGVTLADDPPPGIFMDPRDCEGRDPWWGLLTGYELDIVYEDDEAKREYMLTVLNNSDYIAISSNRFYDTQTRNPMRWPLTIAYYDWLFSGELGYDLVATFQETFEFGPLRVSDQYLPTYDAPVWLNELEAEEAFSVYDHPVVFLFRRAPDYDPARVAELLYSVPLNRVYSSGVFYQCPEDPGLYFCDPTLVNVQTLSTLDASRAPTQLRFDRDQRAMQEQGGTWSERFHPDSILNTNQVVGVIAWYGLLFVVGWITFPLLFALLPGLADRGYSLAKFAGLFLAGWIAWFIASARVPVWNQAGLIAALLGILIIGVWLARRSPDSLLRWLREHWQRIAVIEILSILAFAVMILVRLSNPDLWHTSFGGEKPMDFAYWNGVLRSTIFPPIDPWFAGGFINYYYLGFVIIGVPALLLGIVPSFAFNLVLPTLFMATGIGAFGVAFTAAAALRERLNDGQWRRLASPYLAGIAALIFCVVLGNLDTPRVALNAVASLGGYQQPEGLTEFLIDEYTRANGAPPTGAVLEQLYQRGEASGLFDRVRYELSNTFGALGAILAGLNDLRQGATLYVSPERWFWAPSRILAEAPGVGGNAITEMPAFTFIYADPHAHMISMPMQFLVMAILISELLISGQDRRRRGALIGAVALLAIAVGMLRATNTWDWITYMILGAVGLGFAWWLRWRTFSRASLIDVGLYVGGFIVLTFAAAFPYTSWFVTSYSSVRPWTDGKSPLWAYLTIHGLFIFLIAALLLWDTGRWLRAVTVGTLRGTFGYLAAGGVIILTLFGLSVVLAAFSYQVTLIVVPLILWIAVLFFRQGQTRAMQYLLALAGLALLLTLGVEYVVLDGDIGRQNTVFKFYLQAWLMFSVVGGVAFAALWRAMPRWSFGLQAVYMVPLALMLAAAALFPIMATRGKAEFRMAPQMPLTLDGMDFMRYATLYEGDPVLLRQNSALAPFPLAEDYALIRWLQDNIHGSPVIIEGQSVDTQYKWNGRISIYTGLPSVIGWNFHQRQQRTLDPMNRIIDMRNANVNAFYETLNLGTAYQIMRFYGVEYIIVGRLERAHYSEQGLAKFDQMVELGILEVVFEEGESRIYRVIPGHEPPRQEVGGTIEPLG